MNLFKIETEVRDQGSGVRGQGSVVNCEAGFTLIEMMVVVTLMSILVGIAYSTLRTPAEQIVCKKIYSDMQLTKMRAIATGYNAYVDFDMNGGAVSDNFYTVYLDTDSDGAFGELSNGHLADDGSSDPKNEFDESKIILPDTKAGSPGVDLTLKDGFGGGRKGNTGVTFGKSSSMGNGPSAETIPADGVSFTDERVQFTAKGTASLASEQGVYVFVDDADKNPSGKGCAILVISTGIIRMSNWNGSSWSNTW